MFDINNYIEDEIYFKKISGSKLVYYKNNKIQFYLKNCKNITRITEYKGKKNILVKIDDKYKNFFNTLEKKFLNEECKKEENMISLMKSNKNGTIIKLKVNKRNNRTYINIFDKYKDEITEDEFESNCNIDCLIEFDRFWEYNDKYGYIILVKKIYIK